jgi:glycosyltransferase involved in cell wall biosynthesis
MARRKMKRLLHISANQLPMPDEPHHTVRIWKELARAFDEYHIIGRARENRFRHIQQNNIHLHLVPALGKRNRSFFLSGFYLFYLIRKHRITHLLSQSSIWGGFAATLAARMYHLPHMVEIHGDVYFRYFRSKKWHERLLAQISRYSLKRATKVRSLSSGMTQMLKEIDISDNVVTIPNRVDLRLFGPKKTDYTLHDPVRIISVGRFVPQKGYALALDSLKRLVPKYRLKLTLIGGGPLIHALELFDRGDLEVELIEWMDQAKLIDRLRTADMYIQPSLPDLGEAMPRTLLEAMAMGLPIIASDIAAIPGILHHGHNGLLIPPDDPVALAEKIEMLITDPVSRENLGVQAHLDALNKYEWNKMFDLYRNELAGMT